MAENVPLTKSEVPTGTEFADIPPDRLAGNYSDDDPIAIDQYFEAADQNMEEFSGLRIPHEEIPTDTRLVRARYTFPGFTPQAIRALPADPRRKHLIISTWATAVTTAPLWSGEYFSVGSSGDVTANANILPIGGNLIVSTLTLDDYTGPLYLGSLLDGLAINFEICAVTV